MDSRACPGWVLVGEFSLRPIEQRGLDLPPRERRFAVAGCEFRVLQFFQRLAIHAVVVGRDVPAADAADVVQRVCGEDGDSLSVRLAQCDGRHGRIGEILASAGWVHLHLVRFSKWIHRHRALAHEPAEVEHMLLRLRRAERDLRWLSSSGCSDV